MLNLQLLSLSVLNCKLAWEANEDGGLSKEILAVLRYLFYLLFSKKMFTKTMMLKIWMY